LLRSGAADECGSRCSSGFLSRICTTSANFDRLQNIPAISFEMISQKAKYALKAVLALAKADPSQVTIIGELAERENIPKKFLEQILLDLKHHGIVASRRGKAGGYSLLKPPQDISFGEILRIVDGPLAPLPCLSRMAYRRCEDCADEGNCEVRRAFATVAEASRTILDSTSIASILQPERRKIDSLLAG
jgi:Rrf2 family protein